MKITYILTENDYLQHQLFVASKSVRIKAQRKRSWLIYSAALLALSLLFYQSGNIAMTYFFLTFGIVSLCFFPVYQKFFYKNHYKEFIADTYRHRFGEIANVSLHEDYIETNDITGQSKINLTEIENITETSNYFYLAMRTGGYLIMPKYRLADSGSVCEELKKLCGKLSVQFIEDLNWRWK